MKKIMLTLFLLVSASCFGLAQEARQFLKSYPIEINGHLDSMLERFIGILEMLEEPQENEIRKQLKINLLIEVRLIEKKYKWEIQELERIIRESESMGEDATSCKQSKDNIKSKLALFNFISEQASHL